MPQRTSPVSRDDLERLSAAVSRNPGDAAFIELGEAYLSLGRPRDAVEVGARGLRANPSSMDGRVMVGRAFCSLHKWKEAQAELLKVVKTDKRHQQAFRLLGEVLMRRGDYERALPVLQHAQNLSPADPDVLGLLKRARAGQALDPPPPVPQPREPQGSAPSAARFDEAPTRVADEVGGVGAGALGRVELDRREVKGDYRAPQEAGVRRSDGRGQDVEAERPVAMHQPPPPEDPFSPLDGAGRLPLAAKKSQPVPTAKPPPGPPQGVRPRVFSGQKPRGEGEAALRQSAAVGEDYLNNLLTNGLLDVPNVRVKDSKIKVASGSVWGRSTQRIFIGLFAMLLLVTAGGTGWYVYDQHRTASDVAGHVDLAQAAIGPGTYQGFEGAVEEVKRAIERDKDDLYPIAVYGQVAALHHLIYGAGNAGEIRSPVGAIAGKVELGEPGHYEVQVATAALTLADIGDREEPEVALRQLRDDLAAALEQRPDDRVLNWLAGYAALRAGERDRAAASFGKAAAGGAEGLAAARIALADLKLDSGDPEGAFAAYSAVLDDAPEHPWAFVGRSLSRSLRKVEPDEAIADINVGLARGAGPAVDAWKNLGMAYALMAIEDFAGARESLAAAAGLDDPRFLARKALAHLELGDFKEGTDARAAIEWYGPEDKRDRDPLVTVIDAELYLARGLPESALAKLEGVDGVRAARARGLALLDLNKPEEAKEAFDAGLKLAPDDTDLQAWREAALYIGSKAERTRADEALAKLGRKSNSKVPRYVHGRALYFADRARGARDKLELSLEDVGEEYPNRYGFRAHVLLAKMAFAEDKVSSARKHVEAALEQNQGYLPAKALAGRIYLAGGDATAALEQLGDVVVNDAASAAEELAWAEAVARVGGDTLSADDKDAALQALDRARKKGASGEELERVATLLNGGGSGSADDGDRDDRRDRKKSSSRRRGRRR